MSKKTDIGGKIAGISWGLFLVWMGVSFLIKWDPSVSLLGVGAIILGAQLARKVNQLNFELFWVIIGGLFLGGGLSALTGVELPKQYIIPGLLIAAGIGVLYRLIQGKR